MKLFSTLIVISHVSWAANHLSSCFCTHKQTLALALALRYQTLIFPLQQLQSHLLLCLACPSEQTGFSLSPLSLLSPCQDKKKERLHWKQLSWRLLFTAKPFGGLEIVRAGTLSLSLSVDSADRVMRGEVSKDTYCCESQSDSVSQAAEWLPSARLDSNTQSVSYPAELMCPVTQHFLLSLLTLASLFISFPFRMHLYTLTPVSSNSFFMPKMALNYAVMTGGMEVDGLSVSCPVHTDSDFAAGGQRVATGGSWGWTSQCC